MFLLAATIVCVQMCAAPVRATVLPDIVMTHIQTGITGGATQEFIALYNNGAEEVDVTGWCLMNKSNISFACFEPPYPGLRYIVAPGSAATVASSSFAETTPEQSYSIVYEPTSTSSGSLVGSSDKLTLLDADETIIDSYGWTSSIPSGSWFVRLVETELPLIYIQTYQAINWSVKQKGELPLDTVERRMSGPEGCAESCEVPILLPSLIITEVLPNLEGSDESKEFIELLNVGDQPVSLLGLQLTIGTQTQKDIALPDVTVEPSAYLVIGNDVVAFTLANTESSVELRAVDGNVIDSMPAYRDPKEGMAWALIDGVWQYTNRPTPGAANQVAYSATTALMLPEATLKPCASNQYRSAETNRCRLIETTVATPAPCKEGQYRNPETNRCRTIVVAATPTPCKPGQERNPETNRCRTIKAMTTADYSVLAATQENRPHQGYIFAAIAGMLALLVGYAIWEWRGEIKAAARRSYHFLRKPR